MRHAITSFPGIARVEYTPLLSPSLFLSLSLSSNGNHVPFRIPFFQFYSLKEKKKRKEGSRGTVHTFIYLPPLLYLPLWSGERHFEPAGSKLNRVNPSKLGPVGTNAWVRVLRWHGSLENWINIRAGCRDKFHRSPTENFGLRDRDTRFSPGSPRKANASGPDSIENSPLHARAKNLRVDKWTSLFSNERGSGVWRGRARI